MVDNEMQRESFVSTVLARFRSGSTKRAAAPERKELTMKLGNSLLLIAVTAGLAVLALTGVKGDMEAGDSNALYEDVDAWFV